MTVKNREETSFSIVHILCEKYVTLTIADAGSMRVSKHILLGRNWHIERAPFWHREPTYFNKGRNSGDS